MLAKVCRNCLQPLSTERRELQLTTCANCAKTIAEAKRKADQLANPPPASPLQAALKQEQQQQLEQQALQKEEAQKQKNVEHFFDDLQKVKKSFW
jgi:hypothetical protein